MSHAALENIINSYHQAIDIDPSNAKAHHHLAVYYSQRENYPVAIHHFEAALRAEPNFLDAHYHAGLLLFKYNQYDMAEAQFLLVLALDAQHIPAHFYLGALSFQADELDKAETHFQCILTVDPNHVPTLINLGALELKRDAGQKAISYFTAALVLDENNIEARRNLAMTFMHYDRFENALTHYDELKKINPLDSDDLYNIGVANAALGQLEVAIDFYQKTISRNNNYAAALNNLAAIYIRLERRDEAIELLQRALKVNSHDHSSRFMLDVLIGKIQNPIASHEYVRNLFNNYALYYEPHLQGVLQYSLPEKSLEILKKLQRYAFQHVLDLGCGTGLSGATLRDCSKRITGVDLSKKMLAHARSKNIYDDLFESDIISFLSSDQHYYDVIQALDVLPYFGDLQDLLATIVPRLNENGILLLSAEISHEHSWEIQNSMRFCHDPGYIQSLLFAHSMKLVHSSKVIARQENEQPLYVMMMAYQKVDDTPL